MLMDIKRAHLNGVVVEDEHAYIELPGEAGKGGKCGRLKRRLYGMRQAASAWERDYTAKLEALGFKKGLAASTVFYCKPMGVRCVAHGDDFTFTGKRRDLFEIKRKMEESYELKMRAIFGGEAEDDKEITLLNRVLIWAHGSSTFEADPTTRSGNIILILNWILLRRVCICR